MEIIFKEGIPGFETLTRFIIVEEGDGIFYYLQSVEDQAIAFPILSPYAVKSDYAPRIQESYFEKLGGGVTADFTLFVIATIREDISQSTINLKAPLLIHIERKVGVQAIVDDGQYQSRHLLSELLAERSH
ncbi:MAG: flagellar assembly protein FliW [Cellulosilyticaceae bacterium]